MRRPILFLLAACLALTLALPAAAAGEEPALSADCAELFRRQQYTMTYTLYAGDTVSECVKTVSGSDWDLTQDGARTLFLENTVYTVHGRLCAVREPGLLMLRTVVYEDMLYRGSGRGPVPGLPDPAEYAWEAYTVDDCGCVTGRVETAELVFYFRDDGSLYAVYTNMFGEKSTQVVHSLSADLPRDALRLPWWMPRLWEPNFM